MAIKSVRQLVEEANKQVTILTADAAIKAQQSDAAIFVDIRDIRELTREGKVENAIHAPRGMLEFWFDPQSEYHREEFGDQSKSYILFCAMGWRSALAAKTLTDMGFDNIAHIEGGFTALKEQGAKISEPPPKTAKP